MSKHKVFLVLSLLCSSVACLLLPSASGQTIVWTNTAGGVWAVPQNWSPNVVPGAGNTAVITNAGNYTVEIGSSAAAASLTLGGASSGSINLAANASLDAGTMIVKSNAVFNLVEANFTGNLTLAAGGAAIFQQVAMDGQVTVANGGFLALSGNCTLEGSTTTPNWMWIEGGGNFNATPDAELELDAPLTNSGTCLLQQADITVDNSGTNLYAGAVVNLPGGVINLTEYANLEGENGYDYMLNQGTLAVFSTNGISDISLDNFTNSGTLDVEHGTLEFDGSVTLEPSGTLKVGLNSSTDYGSINFSNSVTLDLSSLGTFEAVLNGGYVPTLDTAFSVLNYPAYAGYLVNPRLAPQVTWQTSYDQYLLLITVRSLTPEPVLKFTPQSISRDYTGKVIVQVTNLPSGATIVVQKYLDANTNGVVDSGDWLAQQYQVTDGLGSPVIAGVTNFNVPGDLDPTNGEIALVINPVVAGPLQLITGHFLYVISSPTGAFTAITNSFDITNAPYTQSFNGSVLDEDEEPVPFALVWLALPPSGGSEFNALGGVVADASGHYSIPAPPGTYELLPCAHGYDTSFATAPVLALASNATVNSNLSLTPATTSISGSLVDATHGTGLPGILLAASIKHGAVGFTTTDTNGNFTLPTESGTFEIGQEQLSLALHGYVGLNNDTNISVTEGDEGDVTGVTIGFPQATALIYGMVTDTNGNPLPGVRVDGDNGNNGGGIYQSEGTTDQSGNYVLGVLAGNWSPSIDNKNPEYAAEVFSDGPAWTYSNGGDGSNIVAETAVEADFNGISTTNLITGHVLDNLGNPIAGVGVNASETTNGVDYQAQTADTDTNGYYVLNVFPGNWTVSVNCGCSGGGDCLGTNYLCPDTQFADVFGGNAEVNFTAYLAPYQISGQVISESDDAPVAGVEVYARDNGYMVTTDTDSEGSYVLNVSAGTWYVGVNCSQGNDSLNYFGFGCVSEVEDDISTANGYANFSPLFEATAEYAASPASGAAPLTVNFTGPSASDYDNSITNWYWEFGDGGTSTNQSPTYTYNTSGRYTPTLIVDDSVGNQITATGPDIDVEPATIQATNSGADVLYSFTGQSDGAYPYGALIISGNTLYGTTLEAGNNDSGTVFSVNTDGSGFTALYSFTDGADGGYPECSLVLSGNTLYGTTSEGGEGNNGTVFAINTNGSGFITLHTFNGEDGSTPVAGLILAGNTLYGTTLQGGQYLGTVFAINTDGTGFTTLHSFSPSDGEYLDAGLVLSGSTLYGTASQGGSNETGTVFSLATNGTGFTNLHDFASVGYSETNADGSEPVAGLITSGNTLYGTTSRGGPTGDGTVFAVNTDGSDFTTLYSFSQDNYSYEFDSDTNSDGANPEGALVLAGNTLYGTTQDGGQEGGGTLFAVATNGTAFTNLLNGIYGGAYQPGAGLILSSNRFFGTALYGGNNSEGAAFGFYPFATNVPIVTWNNPGPIDYGAALDDSELNATASVPGSFVYSPPAGTVLQAGAGQTLSVTFTPDDRGNYAQVTQTVSIDVNPLPLTLTADPQTIPYGTEITLFGSTNFTCEGLLDGDYIEGVDLTVSGPFEGGSEEALGTYTITPSDAEGGAAGNYDITYETNTLTVVPEPLYIEANFITTYGTPVAGSGSTNFIAYGLVNGDTIGSVTLTVSGPSAGSSSEAIGVYTVTPSAATGGTFDPNNYTISYYSGNLVVDPVQIQFPSDIVNPLHDFTPYSYDGRRPQAGLISSGNTLYGTTYYGGYQGDGVIFSVNTDGSGFTNLFNFDDGDDGSNPEGALLLAGNTLYGTASSGGSENNGTVFAMSTNGTGFASLHVFSPSSYDNDTGGFTNNDGSEPEAGLILSGATLYGTTYQGGSYGYGVVYSVNTNGTEFTTLYNFTGGDDGAYPQGALVLSGNTLYGTTFDGGSDEAGTVFAVNTDGSAFTVVYTFSGASDGANPDAGLILSGNTLYGTTYNGGIGDGVVFAVNTDGTGFTELYSFTGETFNPDNDSYFNGDGANPEDALVLSGNTLYGTAVYGGENGYGTVFSIDTNGIVFETLYNFSDDEDGANPASGLDLVGNTLFGTAQNGGGDGNDGTLFEINLDGSDFAPVYDFAGYNYEGDGGYPQSGLIVAGNTLYGTTSGNGPGGSGTVFGINTDGTLYTNLYDFEGGDDGGDPMGALVLSGGVIYGTAFNGGPNGTGTIYSVNTDGSGFTDLYSFNEANFDPNTSFYTNSDGQGPYGGLILSGNKLYGTAEYGGLYDYGTVFAINTDGSGFTTLYDFTGGNDGADPEGALIVSGNTLYGTVQYGGFYGYGSVFAIHTDGTGFTNLYCFTGGTDGAYPTAGLVLSDGTLYGTASGGGFSDFGTVFAVNTDGSDFRDLYYFSGGSDGGYPLAGLILSGGTLYGTTQNGGNSLSDGTIFGINTNGTSFENLYNFTGGIDGAHPQTPVAVSGNTLYGTAYNGGPGGAGSIVALNITPALGLLVTSADDSGPGTLRQAILNAASGDTITFAPSLSGQTIVLTSGGLELAQNVTIDASTLPGGITINGNNASTIFEVDADAAVTLNSLTISNGNDTSGTGGGGILNYGTLAVNDSTFSGNTSVYGGGAIASVGEDAVLTMNDCTVANNSAEFAGGIWSYEGTTALTSCTVAVNTGTGGTGGVAVGPGSLSLLNTIVANNANHAENGDADLGGAGAELTLSGVNLIGQPAGSYPDQTEPGLPDDEGQFIGTTQYPLNPQLAPLGNYGGPTQTMSPLQGSLAIGNGTTTGLATDQRGFPIGDPPDIGAVQTQNCESDLYVNPGGLIYAGNSVTLTAYNSVANPSYTWSDGETTSSITVSPMATTNYSVIVADRITGCVLGGNSTVVVDAQPVPAHSITFTALHGFIPESLDGAEPLGGLVLSGNILYGTTYSGGTNGYGTVFAVNSDGTGYTNLYSFTNGLDGASPQSTLVISGNTLYGTALSGGSADVGTVFAINIDGSGFTNLCDFSDPGDSGTPAAGLILSGGTLYGTAFLGGTNGEGSVFAVNTNGTGFTNLYSFKGGNDGDEPACSLVLSGNVLYGTASQGGVDEGSGTVFAVNTNGAGFTVVYTFTGGSGGSEPVSGLLLLSNTLYGTASSGGLHNAGTVFAVNTNGTGFTNLHSFGAEGDGGDPTAGLTNSGNTLYGTTYSGGDSGEGTVFAINTDGSGYSTLDNFTGGDDGGKPAAGLVLSGDILYGTASVGGPNDDGTVFAITLDPATTNLYGFSGGSGTGDGASPNSLILSSNMLYGTAFYGGAYGNGTVFGVNSNGTGYTNLYSFTGNSDGAEPNSLILSGNTLYGTTLSGGVEGNGTVFAVNTDGTGFQTLHKFAAEGEGAYPVGPLVLSGNTLYGATSEGGSEDSDNGSLFAINTNGTGFTTLYSFSGGSDGSSPNAGLILSGNTLYGTAEEGGNGDYGTVFAVNTDGTGFDTLYQFTNGLDGANPESALLLSGGTLYGTAGGGGYDGYGTVFSIDTNGIVFDTLYNFSGSIDGEDPVPTAGLVLAGNILFGTTYYGGLDDDGTVFAVDTNGDAYIDLYDFTGGLDGANPDNSVVLSGNTLFGPAEYGGPAGYGTIFAVNIGPALVPTVTWTNPLPIVYGTALTTNQLNATASVPGTFAYSPPAGTVIPEGSQTLSVTFTPNDSVNYGIVTQTATINVTPASLQIVANDEVINFGTTIAFTGNTDFTAYGLIGNDTVGSVSMSVSGPDAGSAQEPQGIYTLTPRCATGGTFNPASYTISYDAGTLVVDPELVPASSTNLSEVVSFSYDETGSQPIGGLIVSNNVLYGTTVAGGPYTGGTVYAVNTDGTDFINLYEFGNEATGDAPEGALFLSGGTLYGTASQGGNGDGTVFSVSTNGADDVTVEHYFSAETYDPNIGNNTNGDGALPYDQLILSGGTLYGTTEYGGAAGYGTVFAVNTNGTGFTTLYNFTGGNDGADPAGGLVLSGNTLYGTTVYGGNSDAGAVFAINTDGTGFTTLYSFTGGLDGGIPTDELALVGGTLYGTTESGGVSDNGTVFAINTDGTGLTNLYLFTGGIDGANPTAGLVFSDNLLFGTAQNGGPDDDGAIFAISTNGASFTSLYDFTGGNDGADPQGIVAIAGSTLFTTASSAGDSSDGTIVSLSLTGLFTPAVTWNNPAPITYGTLLDNNELNATSTIPGTFAYNPPAGTLLQAGEGQTLSVTFTPDDPDYTPFTTNVSIEVDQAPLTIIADAQTTTYGTTIQLEGSDEFSAEGLVGDDYISQVDLIIGGAFAGSSQEPVGVYTITPSDASGGAADNYYFIYETNSLTVEPVELYVAADFVTTYGIPVGGAGWTNFQASGLQNGETIGSVNLQVNGYSDTPNILPIGVYNGTISAATGGTFDPNNYSIFYEGGQFFVDPAQVQPQPTNFNELHTFTPSVVDGSAPEAGLLLAGNTLYGTTAYGGSSYDGNVFALNTDGTDFTNLYNFTGEDDGNPSSQLILVGNTLYGTASDGGANSLGCVFSINTNGTDFQILHSFGQETYDSEIDSYTNGDGLYPLGGLVAVGNTLYGTASQGGLYGYGTLFAINTDGSGFANIYNFSGGGDGGEPEASLILSGGTLYGTAVYDNYSPGGTVFSINTNGSGFASLHQFDNDTFYNEEVEAYTNTDGIYPSGSLLLSGNTLYGTASECGPDGSGTLFAVNTNGTGFTNFYVFSAGDYSVEDGGSNMDGADPYAGLILSGNTLYGTANYGGYGYGTVFAVNTDGTDFTTLYRFTGENDGANPECNLVLSNNILYGTTRDAGPTENGTVFAININGSGFTTPYGFMQGNFIGDGGFPAGGLIVASNTLYGTTEYGGIDNDGTIFAVNTNGTGDTNLYSFTGNGDGFFPVSSLILSGDTLYGTAEYTYSGGGSGSIFAVNTDGTGFTELHDFSNVSEDSDNNSNYDGANPTVGLVLSGNTLYGTAQYGGSAGYGTVFAVNVNGSGFVTLYNFTNGIDGSDPDGQLILSGNTLYGLASYGGQYDEGTLYAINTDGSGFTNLYTFYGDDGTQPTGPLTLSGSTLYGETSGGGFNGYGTVFSVTTNGADFTTLYYFSGGDDGGIPVGGLVLSDNTLFGTAQNGGAFDDGTIFGITTNGNLFENLYTFTGGNDGAHPEGGVALSGNVLYAAATQGGNAGSGTIVSISVNILATPIVTWTNPAPITYGTALSSIQLNATANVPGTFAYTPTNGTVLLAGPNTLSVVFTPTDTNDYTSATTNVTLEVLPGSAGLAWSNPAPIIYGTALSSNQLDATANVPGNFVYNPTNGAVLAAGNNTLSVVFTPTDTNDYSPASTNITLVVLPASTVLTWGNPNPITYGTALSSNQLNATANVPGAFAYNPTNGAILPAGSNTLSVAFTPTDTNDYADASTNVTLVVAAALPVLTWNNPAPIIYGTALSSNQLNATANVPGAFVYNLTNGTVVTNGAILSVGSNVVYAIFTPVDTNDYLITTKSAILDVLPASPTITWSPGPIIYGTAVGSNNVLNATASVAGSFVYTAPSNGTVLTVGSYPLSVVFTPSATNFYTNIITNAATLVVEPEPLTVAANNTNWLGGRTFPTFTGTISGVVNGDNITATYSSAANSNSPAGTYPIVPALNPSSQLTNYAVTLIDGTLAISRGVLVTSPVNGSSFGTNSTFIFSAAANLAAGEQSLALYTNGVQVATANSSTVSTVLGNLASGSYVLTAVATPPSGPAVTSPSVYITVNAPGTTLVDFDALDTRKGVMIDGALSSYLAGFGITAGGVTFGTSLEAATGAEAVNQNNNAGAELPVPSSAPNLFTQAGSFQPVSFTLSFASPLTSFGFTRVGLQTNGAGLISHPAWTATALDASNNVLGSVSEPLLLSSSNIAPRSFGLTNLNIAGVRFDSDSQGGTAAFGAVLLDDLVLGTNSINEVNLLGVTLVQPAQATSPATIPLTAQVTDPFGTNFVVSFYSGPTLIGTGVNSGTNSAFTWSNVLNGTYSLTAEVTDASGYAVFSPPAPVVVAPGANATVTKVDFDDASALSNLAGYLGSFEIGVISNSADTEVEAVNQDALAGGGFVIASSPSNVLTQIGSNGPVSFTVGFTNLLGQFSFTRPELVANPFVTHPAWQVEAFDPLGQLLAATNWPQISSATNVPAQTYTLTNSGAGIASISFNSEGSGFTTVNALVLDDFILTKGSNLPPAVALTSPTNGQALTNLSDITLSAQAAGSGSITGVGFYINGTGLAGSAQSAPYSTVWAAPASGTYILTAVATNGGGLTATSAPVAISVNTSFALVLPPTNQTVGVGNSAVFSVLTSPTNGVAYQWLSNGLAIPGATLSTYTATGAADSAPGSFSYSVIAMGQGVSLTNQPPAVLTVLGPPTINHISPGTNVELAIGTNVTLSVSASDTGVPFYYQWQRNGQFLAGATNSSYTISNAQPSDSGDYQVLVANAVASQESPVFAVTVSFPGSSQPVTTNDVFASSLAIDPTNGPVAGNNSGSPATGELAAIAGKPAGRFLWFNWTAQFTGAITLSTLGSSFDTLLGVYTGDSPSALVALAEDDDMGGYFTSQVSFDCTNGMTYQIAVAGFKGASNSVVLFSPSFIMLDTNYLSVAEPEITAEPASQIVQEGQTVTLSIEAFNATTYQWYFNSAPVNGGNEASLVISNFPAGAAGQYYAVAANEVGSVQSEPAAIELQNTNETVNGSTNLLVDKFGDAVDLTGGETAQRFHPHDAGGDTAGFTLSQSFSTLGATKEEGEPNHAGQPGGASYWYSYSALYPGSVRFDTSNSAFNTILAIYTGPGNSFSTLTNVGSGYTTNYQLQGQPSVVVSNTATTKYYIAIDGYLGASGPAHLNVFFTPSTNSAGTNIVLLTNSLIAIDIAAPGNNYLTTSSNLTVRGTVKASNLGRQSLLSYVQVAVNTNLYRAALGQATYSDVLAQAPGGLEEAVAVQTVGWSTNVTLVPGANLITAQGYETNGQTNVTLPVTRTVFYVAALPSARDKSTLTLQTSGQGRITGQPSGAQLEINKVYTVKAQPASDWIFTNWTGGTNATNLGVVSSNTAYSFIMATNLVLQANFIPNPFIGLAGTYNGLFAPTNGATETGSGFFTATLPPGSRGTYSAKILLDGGSYPFSGAFDLAGQAGQTINRPGQTPLIATLQLNLAATNDPMTGAIINPVTSNGFTSPLTAERATYNPHTNPDTNNAGHYTFIIPSGPNAPASAPTGHATLTDTLAGHVQINGRMPDNAAFSQSVAIGTNGNVPFYSFLYSRHGSIQGWLTLTNDPGPTLAGTNLTWVKDTAATNFIITNIPIQDVSP